MTREEKHAAVDERAAQFHRMIDEAEHFNAGYVSIIGRSKDGAIQFAAVYAEDDDAAAIVECLESEVQKP